MTNENTTNPQPVPGNTSENTSETNRPDYIAKQYRIVRIENGWKTRKERIGVAFKNENGSICFRPAGAQIIEGDVHFFPIDSDED